jgi:hypothetical protein
MPTTRPVYLYITYAYNNIKTFEKNMLTHISTDNKYARLDKLSLFEN